VLGIADQRAEDALFYLATQAKETGLRNRAAALIHELRGSPPPAARPPGG